MKTKTQRYSVTDRAEFKRQTQKLDLAVQLVEESRAKYPYRMWTTFDFPKRVGTDEGLRTFRRYLRRLCRQNGCHIESFMVHACQGQTFHIHAILHSDAFLTPTVLAKSWKVGSPAVDRVHQFQKYKVELTSDNVRYMLNHHRLDISWGETIHHERSRLGCSWSQYRKVHSCSHSSQQTGRTLLEE